MSSCATVHRNIMDRSRNSKCGISSRRSRLLSVLTSLYTTFFLIFSYMRYYCISTHGLFFLLCLTTYFTMDESVVFPFLYCLKCSSRYISGATEQSFFCTLRPVHTTPPFISLKYSKCSGIYYPAALLSFFFDYAADFVLARASITLLYSSSDICLGSSI